ncbi:hypothetical protein, partial [Arthrobacter castelli]|uniref:hypothetical protein n=1 Tax=Arthrobacter castelli TaxID=271431 RepID=UPI00047ABF1A
MALTSPAADLSLRVWVLLDQRPWLKAAVLFAVVCTCSHLILIEQAYADDGGQNASMRTFLMPVLGITDTHGVPIESYSSLPLDYGNATHLPRMVRSAILAILWTIYAFGAFLLIACVDFIVGFEWVDWLTAPFTLVASSLHDFAFQVGLPTTLLMLTGVSIAIAAATGRYASGVIQLVKASTIFAILAVFFVAPISALTAGSDDPFATSSSYGSQLGSGLVSEDGKIPEDPDTNPVSGPLVDLLLRTPALAISFGSNVSAQCLDVFDDTAKSTGDDEAIRQAVTDCDPDAKAANETDSWVALGALMMFWLSSAGVLAILAVFTFFILKDTVLALLSVLGAIINGIIALGPGVTAATAFVRSALNIALCVAMIGIYTALLTVSIGVVNLVIGLTAGFLARII